MTPTLRDMLLKNEDISKSLNKTFMIESKEEAIKLICPDLKTKIDKITTNKIEEKDAGGFFSSISSIYTIMSAVYDQTQETSNKHNAATLKYYEVFDKIMQSIGLHIFTGETQSYWKDLQTEDTKVMIISVPGSCRVRSANDKSEGISSKDANGKFLILDGLVYKSSDNYNPIVYMEI
jgi:hypothetical protein